MQKKIYKFDDFENLSQDELKHLYKSFVNTKQAELFFKLSFGRDIFVKAQGMYLYNNLNEKILDFTGGMGVLNLGHNHHRILEVRKKFQELNCVEVHKQILSPFTAMLSSNIAKILPTDLNKSYFCNSGAEAVEGSIKMAYKFHNSKRNLILHSNISFHGHLIGAGSISGNSNFKKDFPHIKETDQYIYNDINSIKQKIDEHTDSKGNINIYAIIVEPYHALSLQSCSENFLQELRILCNKYNIILIYDEVYVGWGKTGYLFYFMKFKNTTPDILATSKSLGGGKSSISAFIAKDFVFEKAYGTENDALLHSTTYNSFGEECVTAMEAIQIIFEENLIENAKLIGQKIHNNIEKLTKKHHSQILKYMGEGALYGFILKSSFNYIEKIIEKIPINTIKDKSALISKLPYVALMDHLYNEHKILTHINKDPNHVIFLVSPSLIVKNKQIDYFFQCLDSSFEKGINRIIFDFIIKYFKS